MDLCANQVKSELFASLSRSALPAPLPYSSPFLSPVQLPTGWRLCALACAVFRLLSETSLLSWE